MRSSVHKRACQGSLSMMMDQYRPTKLWPNLTSNYCFFYRVYKMKSRHPNVKRIFIKAQGHDVEIKWTQKNKADYLPIVIGDKGAITARIQMSFIH